tara:strand:- start:22 stop:621 length:600 start_codon:yes stop_codon:yes gene_type:complete
MFNKIYQKTLSLAAHKNSKKFLAIISFAESSFFPIPPDIMIIPMVVAKKTDYTKIFLIATLFSVLGGLFGYFVGSTFLEIAMRVVEIYGYEQEILQIENKLLSNRINFFWILTVFIAAFTPLVPFKVFTITSGLISFNIIIFIIICIVARGLRFFIVAFLSAKFGQAFGHFLKKNGTKWFSIIGLIIVTIAIIVYFIIK